MRPYPIIGLMVIACGLALVMRAHWEMGASWRIGIDHGARPGLVTGGLYRFTRNPIYSGIGLIVVGYVLAMPTPTSVLLFIAGTIGIVFIVRREERYLVATYGDEFRAYASRVGRFDPWLGRLRKE
jgi:protein-S-isoprenylcysteine O-methyltransferase Ste14